MGMGFTFTFKCLLVDLWLMVLLLMLLNAVDGLKCDVCYQRFGSGLKADCLQLRCDTYSDPHLATSKYWGKRRKIESPSDPDYDDEFRRRLADRQGADEDDGDKKPKYICAKGVGTKPTKGGIKNYNTLQSSCLWADVFEKLPPIRNEPYEGSSLRLTKPNEDWDLFAGLDVTICDETNEDKCRVTEEELTQRPRPDPPPGDPARGLECDVCFRIGQDNDNDNNTKRCDLMPCNDWQDYMKAWDVAWESYFEWLTVKNEDERQRSQPRGQGRPGTFPRSSGGNDYVCVRLHGTRRMVDDGRESPEREPITFHGCYPSVRLDGKSPQNAPYKSLPKGIIIGDIAEIDPDKLYICDESNRAVCRVNGPKWSENSLGLMSASNHGSLIIIIPLLFSFRQLFD